MTVKLNNRIKSRYPLTLLDLRNLEGGSYGRFTLVARDPDTLEIQLGSDFVRINAEGARKVGEVFERFACGPSEHVQIDVEEEPDGDVVVTVKEDEGPKLPRRRARKTQRGNMPPSSSSL